jgi:glucose/arabinose dehydrogenase
MGRHPFLLALLLLAAPGASAQLTVHDPDLSVTQAARVTVSGTPVRLAYLPASDEMVLSMLEGKVLVFPRPTGGSVQRIGTVTYDAADHGLTGQMQGMTTGPDGSIYLVATRDEGANFVSSIAGKAPGENWRIVAETEPYPRSGTPFDHKFNGLAASDDGRWLFVASGSRTDHGEIQGLGNAHPGVREVPLTSAMLRIPAGATDLVIPAGDADLSASGLLYADGFRNAFDLAFDGRGRLFATENGWDRDGPEELNLIQEGHHYGFPWKLGTDENPQRDPGYNPSTDLLLNPSAYAVSNGFYANDPTYPAPPSGVEFADPIRNFGPDAARIRRASDGAIVDASIDGTPVSTFTGHGSPLGLVFDREANLAPPYQNGGFFLNWTGRNSPLFGPYGEPGEDLLHLALSEDAQGVFIHTTRIVSDFAAPIDAVLVGHVLYVLEMSGGRGVWAVEFPESTGIEKVESATLLGEPFPNPVTQGLPVRMAIESGVRRVVLFDVLGRTVRAVDVSGGAFAEIPTAGLAPGIYALRPDEASQTRLLTVVAR